MFESHSIARKIAGRFLLAGLIFILVLISCTDLTSPLDSDLIPDAELEKVIRLALRKFHEPISISDLQNIEKLTANHESIYDLTGLEYCCNLEELMFIYCEISDLSPLENLLKLRKIEMWSNNIEDISPLSGLINLNTLHLSNNEISDLEAISNLTGLMILYLANNHIDNINASGVIVELQTAGKVGGHNGARSIVD